MKKNGFTLIELLAVIVILAIIALIATPIILGIINDARKEGQERSVELYASAVRNGIAAYQLREMKEVAAGSYTTETLPFDVEYDGEIECSKIELYEDGGVYVAGCEVNDVEVDYTYGTKKVIKGKLSSVCTPAEEQYFADSPLEAGYEYECKVDPNKAPYTFYVLTTVTDPDATSINLIMDSNINKSGEAVKEGVSDTGLVAWYAGYSDNSYGPITAMNHLQTATVGWTNVNNQTINKFTDEEGNTYPMTEYIVNARMPYYSEVSDYDASTSNAYLYNNLYAPCEKAGVWDDVLCSGADDEVKLFGVHEEGMTHVLIEGYWTLSTPYNGSINASLVHMFGDISLDPTQYDDEYGVRPVINLSI